MEVKAFGESKLPVAEGRLQRSRTSTGPRAQCGLCQHGLSSLNPHFFVLVL